MRNRLPNSFDTNMESDYERKLFRVSKLNRKKTETLKKHFVFRLSTYLSRPFFSGTSKGILILEIY